MTVPSFIIVRYVTDFREGGLFAHPIREGLPKHPS